MSKHSWWFLGAALTALVVISVGQPEAWADDEAEGPPPKNLKVLPEDMARKDVVALMKQFNKALGVKCKFCHNTKDYASDENKHKEIARNFMRMTADMEAKYFQYEKAPKVKYNCYVCHRGDEEPVMSPR
ncbi:MAG: c-type cytochrome [Myxococcota bacterium]